MSIFRPYWWTREGGDDQDPDDLASTRGADPAAT
jgi:hypothetical protein